MSDWTIRSEQPGDEVSIAALVALAFKGLGYSDGNEAQIVERLREAGMLSVSLVAEEGWDILGHVAFSPVSVEDCTQGWFGLAPVAVTPGRQREGIGAALIEAGLAELRGRDAAGCVVLGNPAFYSRFGFAHDPDLAYPGPPAEHFQCLVLAGPQARGVVSYAPAFG